MDASHAVRTPRADAAEELYVLQAAILRAVASPRRLVLIHRLGEEPGTVASLSRELRVPLPTVSQDLAALRSVGLIEATRQGRGVSYRLVDVDVRTACDLMRAVLLRHLSHMGSLARAR